MQLSTDPFAAHHLVVKTPAHLDTGGPAAKRSKLDEEGVVSDVTTTTEQGDKEMNTEKASSVSVEAQPMEVCISCHMFALMIPSCVQLPQGFSDLFSSFIIDARVHKEENCHKRHDACTEFQFLLYIEKFWSGNIFVNELHVQLKLIIKRNNWQVKITGMCPQWSASATTQIK